MIESFNDNVMAGIYGMLAAQGEVEKVRADLRAQELGPCTCDREEPFVATLLADPLLRKMMISQGEAGSDEELYAYYRDQRAKDGCGSSTCKTNPSPNLWA